MTLETVKSSSVYAIGYDEERQRLVVVFKGYEYPATREQFEALKVEALKEARSIGRAVAMLTSDKSPSNEGAKQEALDSYDADPCCGVAIFEAIAKGIHGDMWNCPKCGCLWKAKQIGPVRHWEPVPLIAVL